jgi:hypothetical protein
VVVAAASDASNAVRAVSAAAGRGARGRRIRINPNARGSSETPEVRCSGSQSARAWFADTRRMVETGLQYETWWIGRQRCSRDTGVESETPAFKGRVEMIITPYHGSSDGRRDSIGVSPSSVRKVRFMPVLLSRVCQRLGTWACTHCLEFGRVVPSVYSVRDVTMGFRGYG